MPGITDLPVGTPVRYWTGFRIGEGKTSHTRSEVKLLGGHTWVVWVEDESSCIALTHVEVLPGDETVPDGSLDVSGEVAGGA